MILVELALSWPPYGRYLSRNETVELVEHWQVYASEEEERGGGSLPYFHAKIKANADFHQLAYDVPAEYQYAYERMFAMIKRQKLPQPFRALLGIFKPIQGLD